MKKFKCRIEGVTPFIMHNSEGASPMCHWTKLAKPLKAKRTKKTDEDQEKLLEIGFLSSLYWSDELNGLYLPSENIEKMILEAGRRCDQRGAKSQYPGIIVPHFLGFKFETPNRSDMEKLRQDPNNKYFRIVKIQNSRTPSMRAIFHKWACSFELEVDPEIINPSTAKEWLEVGGKRIGLGCRRPSSPTPNKFGRFQLVEFEEVK